MHISLYDYWGKTEGNTWELWSHIWILKCIYNIKEDWISDKTVERMCVCLWDWMCLSKNRTQNGKKEEYFNKFNIINSLAAIKDIYICDH